MAEVEKNALVVPGRNGALLTKAALEGILLLLISPIKPFAHVYR
jgi:hypothetical protein